MKEPSPGRLSRRDFLKLALALPLTYLATPSLLGTSSLLGRAPHTGEDAPGILIVVFDALSASHLSLHGYARQTMPNLERFARRANVYHAHHSTANFTTPGTASLLTGAYPWSHRALHLNGTMLESYARRSVFQAAGPQHYRLAYSHNLLSTLLLHQLRADLDEFHFSREASLADMEYSDLLFPGDYNASSWGESAILRGPGTLPSSLFLAQAYRLWAGLRERLFNREYGDLFPKGIPNMNGVYYRLEEGIDWCTQALEKLPQPFLSYVHFMPPHTPYTPHAEFVGRFDDGYQPPEKPRHRFAEKGISQAFLNQQRQAYDEHLAYVDSQFGRLHDQLEASGLLDKNYLVFTSDHGELFERGIWGHSTRVLYEPVIRTPLLISAPGQRQRQDFHTLTSSIDLLPTLAQAMGVPRPEWAEGQILPGFEGGQPQPARAIYAVEAKQNSQRGPLSMGTFAMLKENYKLISYRGYSDFSDAKDELYNLADDPEELDNRYKAEKPLAQEMRRELEKKLQEVGG